MVSTISTSGPGGSRSEATELPLGALAAMKGAHASKLALCEMLEQIADSLPNRLDRAQCETAAKLLTSAVARFHRFEEDIVFPVYSACAVGDNGALQTVERLRFEHRQDEDFAFELSEQLLAAATAKAFNAEMLGFMLRGFFTSMRRHIAFESEHVIARLEAVG